MITVEKLRPAASALLNHGVLVLKLAQVEWALEKARLVRMLALSLLAVVMMTALMLFLSILIMVLCWNTPYRWLGAGCVVALHGGALWLIARHLLRLSHPKQSAFADTRDALAADFALLRRDFLP